MTDTKGKGLLLAGGCGRGKSVVATGVIPVLLKMATNCTVRAIHAEQFERSCTPTVVGMPNKSVNLDYLCSASFPIIDDMGVEVQVGNYGEKYEGINRVLNVAEQQAKAVFITTNLNSEEVMERYGMRTFDRLKHLCKIVKFKQGDSLRK
jgi:DNA replication protein DnaC